jgi:hypothetical protein
MITAPWGSAAARSRSRAGAETEPPATTARRLSCAAMARSASASVKTPTAAKPCVSRTVVAARIFSGDRPRTTTVDSGAMTATISLQADLRSTPHQLSEGRVTDEVWTMPIASYGCVGNEFVAPSCMQRSADRSSAMSASFPASRASMPLPSRYSANASRYVRASSASLPSPLDAAVAANASSGACTTSRTSAAEPASAASRIASPSSSRRSHASVTLKPSPCSSSLHPTKEPSSTSDKHHRDSPPRTNAYCASQPTRADSPSMTYTSGGVITPPPISVMVRAAAAHGRFSIAQAARSPPPSGSSGRATLRSTVLDGSCRAFVVVAERGDRNAEGDRRHHHVA